MSAPRPDRAWMAVRIWYWATVATAVAFVGTAIAKALALA